MTIDTVSGLSLFAKENRIIEKAKEVGFTAVFYLNNEDSFRQETIR